MEKHKAFLDTIFKMLINNIHGNISPIHWKDLNEDYDTPYDTLN